MRTIAKRSEPASLTKHRAAGGDFDNYPAKDKDELRQALVAEQRELCCYCMGRIRGGAKSMKIEHWRSRSRFPDRQLDYRNLLAACNGGEGKPWHRQHCDTRKGNREFRWNPAESSHNIERRFAYEPDGSIVADDDDVGGQINSVLNLNLPMLRNNRKFLLDAILRWWRSEKNRIRGPLPRDLVLRRRNAEVSGSGALEPYCQVIVWWLDQKLAKRAT